MKAERNFYLYKNGEVLRRFDILLGLVPEGPEQREGDFRVS